MTGPTHLVSHYTFNYYAIPYLMVSVFVIGLGAFVLLREWHSHLGFIFSFTSLSTGLYVLSSGMTYLSADKAAVDWWIRMAYISSAFIPWAGFLLTAAILDIMRRFRKFIAVTFALTLLFAGSIIFSHSFIRPEHRVFFWGDAAWFGPMAWVFIIYFVGMVSIVLFLLRRAYTDSTNQKTKKRFQGIIISVLIGALALLDALPGLGVEMYPFGYVSITCYTAGLAFVIMRYRLQNITPEVATSQILETMNGAVIVVDLDRKIRVVNRAAQDMLGYPRNDLLGKDLSKILAVHAGTNHADAADGNGGPSEMVWSAWNGRQMDVSVSSSSLTDPQDGTRIGTVYVAQDITARKVMEMKIKRAATEWTATFDAITDSIMVLDSDQRIIRCNKATRDLLGRPYQEIIGRRCFELIHGSTTHYQDCPTQRMLISKRRETMTLTMAGRINFVTSDPVFDEHGRIHRIIHTVSDITEQTQLEMKLRQAQTMEAIGRLASGVAHEVRNPLNAILSISEALFTEREIKGRSEYDPYINHIRVQVKRLSDLMKDLLELGRPIPQANVTAVPLASVCQEVLNVWSSTEPASDHPVTLTSESASEGPVVLADEMRLQQILINLLDNAAQNSPKNRGIELRITEAPDTWALIHIHDSGTGIPPEKIDHVFDPFFTTRKGGTGLGLSIVRHYVEHMGGSVDIRNNEHQPGCTAVVRLRTARGGRP